VDYRWLTDSHRLTTRRDSITSVGGMKRRHRSGIEWMLLGMYVAAAADIVIAVGIWWLIAAGLPDCVVQVQKYVPTW
jgi:hypothetical protein